MEDDTFSWFMMLKGLSQVELSGLLGLSRSAVGNYESGISSPKEGVLWKLMEVLDVDANYIFQDIMKKNNPATNMETKKLPNDEEHLLGSYRTLNDAGKKKATDWVDDLTLISKYNADNHSDKVTLDFYTHKETYDGNVINNVLETTTVEYWEDGAAAGMGNYHSNYNVSEVELPVAKISQKTDFAILVDGKSMEPTIPDKSLALSYYSAAIRQGQIGIFTQGSDVWIKEAGGTQLLSHNEDYPHIPVPTSDDADPIRVVGVVLGWYNEVDGEYEIW